MLDNVDRFIHVREHWVQQAASRFWGRTSVNTHLVVQDMLERRRAFLLRASCSQLRQAHMVMQARMKRN